MTQSAIRTLNASLTDAHRSLMQAAFHQPPVFRMGFDAHVQKWRAHVQRETYVAYHKVGDFARLYDAEVQRRSSAHA